MFRHLVAIGLAILLTAALGVLLILIWQGKRKPDTSGEYVALGSSYAAGLGLGPREPGSPIVCMRSSMGYPHLLARMTGLSLVDMACSGSTTAQILRGGQVFLGPQIAAIGAHTRLVTITSGGNDVGYIGDLTLASGRAGFLGRLFWKGPKPAADRAFAELTDTFRTIVQAIRKQAPKATIALVSYPVVLPDTGTCAGLGFDQRMADIGREVATRLHEATRLAAEQSGAIFVDMASASKGHDACSHDPWVNGTSGESGAPFHPNLAGAKATAAEVFKAISGKFPEA